MGPRVDYAVNLKKYVSILCKLELKGESDESVDHQSK